VLEEKQQFNVFLLSRSFDALCAVLSLQIRKLGSDPKHLDLHAIILAKIVKV
jgi:hypothetical protein